MKPILFLILFLVYFGGCAATYRHPAKGVDTFEKDRQACEVTARKMRVAKGMPGA